jgi:hypothetical protein
VRVEKCILKIPAISLVCLLCFLSGHRIAAQTPPKALSKTEVVDLLQGAVPPDRIAEIVRKRGIDFQVTPEIERDLRGAGATLELIETLRELAPAPPKPQPLTLKPAAVPAAPVPALLQLEGAPKGAEIYVDDEFKGQVSREGHLKVPELSAGKHVVRISAQGYQEKVETLDLAPGETRTYTPSLTSLARPPAPLPALKPVLAAAAVSVFYESLGDSAKLTLQVRPGDSPVLFVDVNGNGRIDRGDTAYGLTNDERPCTQYLLGPDRTSLCGSFHSRGALEVKNDSDWTRYIWTIPKSELSREGRSVQFVVSVYSSATHKWAAYPSEPFSNPVRTPLH